MRHAQFSARFLIGAVLAAVLPLAVLTGLTAYPAQAQLPGNLLVNGSFEDPQLATGTYTIYPHGSTDLPGWFSVGDCGVEVQNGVDNNDFVIAADGHQYSELASNCAETTAQDVATTAGTTYTLSFAFQPRPQHVTDSGARVTAGDATLLDLPDGALTAGVWTRYVKQFTATAATTRIGFTDTSGMLASYGVYLDDVSLVPATPYTPAAADVVAANTSWPNAQLLPDATTVTGTLSGGGDARWYKFSVVPGSSVKVDLTGLAADADLAVFRDIGAAFTDISSTTDLARLSAEFAGDAYSPSVYSPSVYSPSVYSPAIFSPSVYSPSVYSPSVYSPSVYSPSVYSPSVYSPSVYSPSVYSPSAYIPSVYSPSPAFLDAFASAQTRSLIALSALTGTADESITTATWNNTGFFYVRVQSRSDAAGTPFSVRRTTTAGPCDGIALDTGASIPLPATPGTPTTVVLTDTTRLGLTGTAKSAYLATLGGIGTVVDAADVARTQMLNAQADANPRCTYAKNLVAQSLRDIVNRYRANGTGVKYVVIAGADAVVPFFRYPDTAGIGPESDFVPPLGDATAANAALRGNQTLGQDAYGTLTDIAVKGTNLPVPDLAVGRLVETPAEITAQVNRYLGLANGALPQPHSSLVTGYDFLTRAADSVEGDLVAGLGAGARTDTLITNQGVPTTTTTVNGQPDRQHSWTADDLRSALLGSHHDLVFLAGHFSSSDALAADYRTSVTTADVAAKPGLLTGSVVWSAGCHSGYNVLDSDGIAGLTPDLDWAQEMAQQQAILIAGSGYQYADTDFLAYSAKLYAQFTKELRAGSVGSAVPIGQALVQAKQDYLSGLTSVTGIDEKSVLEATLYGLPMTGLDLPAGRTGSGSTSGGISPAPVAAGTPGAQLGLQSAMYDTSPAMTVSTRPVLGLDGTPTGATYRWLTGPDGVRTAPALPALPLDSVDVTSNDGSVLRGIGFRSGTYADSTGVLPLTGAPATEQNGVHTSFESPVFWPGRLASGNWFGSLATTGDDRTRLLLTAAQYRAEPGAQTSTERRYDGLGLQLFYSRNTTTYGSNTPALAAPPSISQVKGTADDTGVNVSAAVTGDPSAGIQGVWVTYTAESGPLHGRWTSVDLTQSATDSTAWSGRFPLPSGQAPAAVRFLVQAVNGVGLVALDDAFGDGYVPLLAGQQPVPPAATSLSIGSVATSGRYGSTLSVPVTLTGAPAGSTVTVQLGGASASAATAADGTATVALPLRTAVGAYPLTATYDGDATHQASAATGPQVTVQKALTTVTPSATTGTIATSGSAGFWFTLRSGGVPLPGKGVLVGFSDVNGKQFAVVERRTDGNGRVYLDSLTLPKGKVYVGAAFAAGLRGSPLDPTYLGSAGVMQLQAK